MNSTRPTESERALTVGAESVPSRSDAIRPASMTTTQEPCADQATPSTVAALEQDRSTPTPTAATADVAERSLGEHLQAARMAHGWSCEEAAHRLRFPASVIRALEAERYEQIGYGIYLRGYLIKYLQLLDLPLVLAERVLKNYAEPPPLLRRGSSVSRSRDLITRYSGSALYLVLTAVIVVPAVLLATHGGLESGASRITPLDTTEPSAAGVAGPPLATLSPTARADREPAPDASEASAPTEQPLTASMTPFPPTAPTANPSAATPPPPAEHQLSLRLSQPSWVEVVTADGAKLEFGLLPAGSVRSYPCTRTLEVRLGNVEGATVEIDGQRADLTPFRHANVAHFRLPAGSTTLTNSGG
jgi:cytoskeleton protein RodZ